MGLREAVLMDYLRYGMYPPMDALYETALAAINGEEDEEGLVPAPALGEKAYVPAQQVIDNLRLHHFLED